MQINRYNTQQKHFSFGFKPPVSKVQQGALLGDIVTKEVRRVNNIAKYGHRIGVNNNPGQEGIYLISPSARTSAAQIETHPIWTQKPFGIKKFTWLRGMVNDVRKALDDQLSFLKSKYGSQ